MKKFLCDCGKLATWAYGPGHANEHPYYCDDCVPRGCSCNREYTPDSKEGLLNGFGYYPTADEKFKWLKENICWTPVDDKGREFPCIEYCENTDGFEASDDEIKLYTDKNIVFYTTE